ncbi:MAG TPA: sigma-70 family RNA polymerase sigma factor [Gemmataceae bacterium]|nr:sigma-70 family RNA polymerase sigma factor [Gemmataceae bacterium]
MSVRSIEALLQYLRRLREETVPPEDAVLLNRFVTANDHDAFELLMARHGPMVLGTAQRLVENSHDAEDVFQAVFLSLARLAKSIRQGRALPAWLHKTTYRIAAKFRANRLRQAASPPERYEQDDPAAGLVWREVCQALDEELQRLPERLRSPLLLCYLAGLSRDEAAKKLGWSLGTLKRRLEEGRKALRIRLERRGIASVGLALTVLIPDSLQAEVSMSLRDSSLRLIFSGGAVVPTTISALALSSAVSLKGIAMKSMLVLLAAIAVGVGIYAGTGHTDPQMKAEGKTEEGKSVQEQKAVQMDDPLPPGCTLRFGTSRFRLGIPVKTLAVSADGKLAVAVNPDQYLLGNTRVFDLISGRALFTLGRMEIEAAAISPDGRTIVTKQNFGLHIRDAATGKEQRTIELPRANPHSDDQWVAFTPDGKAIAVTSKEENVIHLIDFESRKTIRDFRHDNPESKLSKGFETVLGIAFSPDGKWMASGGFDNDKGNYFARLRDVQSGKELRRFMHAKNSYGIPSLAFSPNAKTLATRSHDGRLRLFDVDSGKERKTFPADGGGRRLGTVAFSPDGKTVAAAGDSIRLYDAATGEERLRIDRKQATGLRFTDGGKTLVGGVAGAIYKWDTATGKALTPDAAGDSTVEQIMVTPDGRRVVTRGEEGDSHLWDAANGKHLRAWKAAWQRGLAMSPDGRFLVWPVVDEKLKFTDPDEPRVIFDGNCLRLYDIEAGRFVDRFYSFKGDADDLFFTHDGKRLFTVGHRNGMVRLWNVETGKEERSFQAVPKAEKKQSYHVRRTALAPDGKTLAVGYDPVDDGLGGLRDPIAPHLVRLWDVPSGQALHTLNGHDDYLLNMAFSPDDRLLVTASERSAFVLNEAAKRAVFVWDTATGKRVAALPDGLQMGATAVVFSGDGRFLATALPEGALRIWEVATWTLRNEFKGHRDRTTALTFAPGGQLLSGSVDTTVLAWDLRPPRVAASAPLESAWKDLAAREAGESFQSEGRFLAAPADTVKLLAEKVKPAAALDPKRIQRLLVDLGSDVFAVREAASQALLGLDEQAIPYLEATLKNLESLEVRIRVQRILEQKRRAAITAEQLRQIRAVMVLERIGDGASKNLLQRWAGGPGGAVLTMEAAVALKRLEAVPKANR